jgi:hypothetical protein
MNGKTEHQNTSHIAEFSPLFIRGLIITTCATLLFVFFGDSPYSRQDQDFNSFLATQISASGIMVEYAIQEFQGTALKDVTLETKPGLLISLMLEFVILPLCFLYSWRYLFLKTNQRTGGDGKPKRNLAAKSLFGISGVLIVYLILGNITSALVSPKVYQTIILDNADALNREAVIAQLTRMGHKANEYFVLPKNLDGGNSSYRSMHGPSENSPVSLQELEMPAATESGIFSIVQIVNDTTLVCKGIGNVAMHDGSLPEYTMRISPGNAKLTKTN